MKGWIGMVCLAVSLGSSRVFADPPVRQTEAEILGYDHIAGRVYFSLTPQDESESIPIVFYYCFAESCGSEPYVLDLKVSDKDDPEHFGERVEKAIKDLKKGLQPVEDADAGFFESSVSVTNSDSTSLNSYDRVARHRLHVSLKADSLEADFYVTAYYRRQGKVVGWYTIPRIHWGLAVFSYPTLGAEGSHTAQWVVVLRPPAD